MRAYQNQRKVRPWATHTTIAIGCAATLAVRAAESAARAQADYDKIEALLDAGESLSVAAWGSWHETVPDGYVGLAFTSRTSKSYHLVPKDQYESQTVALSHVDAQPWPDHPGTVTKQVAP